MKRTILSCLLVISVASGTLFGQKPDALPSTAKPAYTIPILNKTLSNGLEVIVYPDSNVPIVTVELAARNGSFTEPPELNGLSHLYEHMFFKGNQAVKNQEQYLKDIGQMGITYNGTTREEVVNYYFTTTSANFDTAIRYIKDSVRYPLFDEEEFKREKEVVIGEIDRNESNPFFYLTRAMSDKLFYKYPTRKNSLGTRETVANATTDQMRLIQGRYYVPNNMALTVTGDVDPNLVFASAEKYFGDWPRRPVDPFKEFPLVEHPPLPKSEGVILQQPVNNVLITIGWQGPSVGKDTDATYAADVFSYIITQPDSKFERDLVDSGLAVGADFGYYTQRNVGPIQLTLATTPDKARAALAAVYKEIAQFDKPGYFTDQELENAKTILESRDLFDREKLSEYVHTLSFWWSSTGIDYFKGYYAHLRATTRKDTNRYVQTYILGKPHVGVAMLSPESQAQAKLTEADLIGQ
ncbi:MAG: insulinase family protein [Acidobacteria bacterium]|nr:insulinase family protein [Acidobacteriota bacterium]